MASLGTFTLLAAFVVSAYAAAAAVTGARRGSRSLIDSAIGAFYFVAALLTVGTAVIIHAFVTDDYSIKYVQHYSDTVQPFIYKLTSYWGGLDGSIMFWVFLLAIFGSVAVHVNRERHRELMPYVVAIISVVQMFFLFLMVIHKNPFETYLLVAPTEGKGLNPLLQNAYMAIHPPSLYVGFVGMTIPFAFGLAALITGHLDDAWLRAVRRWTMVSWLFLSFGLTLGMIWAYEVLGWGGYWGWDPVENAGLLPWLTGTAFLHSVMVQERRGMLRVWNVTLVVVTFFLTIFGTFMTRSGVVQSVHAFGEDRQLAWLFTGFMLVILTVSFGYIVYRLPLLRSRHELDSWVSREAAFLVNNWVLLFAALFVLFATMFPTISEALTGERLTVGPPFFNKWMLPIGLILLFLTGVGPLLAWRKSTPTNLREQFLWATIVAVLTPVGLSLAGIPFWPPGLCFALCAFVGVTVVQEFVRGAAVRRQASGTDYLTAMVGLVARSKRRYGGYIVHLGIVLMFLGFTGQAFKIDEQMVLKPGQQAQVGHYVIRNDGVRVTDDGQKQMITGHLTVFRDGKEIDKAFPGKWLYRRHEQEPVSQVAIRRSVAEDLYIVMPGFELQDQSVSLQVVINPLVDWIWVGFGVLALGTMLALLPEQALGFATSKVPAPATIAMLVLVLLLMGGPVAAQHVESPAFRPVEPKTALERDLYKSLICMCGTCGRQLVGECTCGYAAEMRAEIGNLVKMGLTREQVLQYYIKKYGSQEPLAMPIDKGFNRLAWLFPYVIGAGGLLVVGIAAIRWSRRPAKGEPAPALPTPSAERVDTELEARLDDELRDLD
ncbi:MAG TPA: cytochrome c-type biogenesis CcmF C-terminal domain-containing protein [Vicinamibacterales bacterium]|jgi:cytochrome c-type biogenesis protein CcmF